MAFLNFIFKDKHPGDEDPSEASLPSADERDTMPSEALAEGETPESGTGGLEDAEVANLTDVTSLDAAEEMDLDQLVEALQLISELLGDEDEDEAEESVEELKNAVTIEFTVEQVSDLLTEAFDRNAVATTDTAQKVGVIVEDVFAQLGRGKVTTTVVRVLAEVPPDLIASGYDRFSKDDVSLPLHLVVAQVQPDELEKRIATEEAAPDLDSMPNLFSGTPPAAAEADDTHPEASRQPDHETQPGPGPSALDDPFSIGTPRTGNEEADADEPPKAKEEGSLKFELSENASIFNFGPSPASDSGAEATTEEAPLAETEPEPETVADETRPTDAESAPEPEEVADETRPTNAESAPEPEAVVDETLPTDAESGVPASVDPGPMVPVEDDPKREADPLSDVNAPEETDGVMLGGLDLNTANAQLISSQLNGVGPKLASRIIKHRDVNGPFRSIADLTRVQGVGPSTYEKMTGASWSEARDNLKRTLDYVLGDKKDDIPDLKGVARRIRSLSGFEGCIFTHTDGHTLAASWDHDQQEVLGAVAPQVFKKMLPYIEELDMGDLNPVMLFLGDTVIAVLQTGDLMMATIHRAAAFSRRQIRLIELIGTELEQRLEGPDRE